jgi:fructose-1,6-bisphosphatase/inositol monophosphatase family enzyme
VKAALTLADTAAQEAILVPLLERWPGVSVEPEEDTPSVAGFAAGSRARVVVDPIDGTLRSYLEARGPYGCMVGLSVDGIYRAALVALPREGLFFDCVRGGTAHRFRPGAEARPWRAEASGQRVLISYDMPEPVVERLRAEGWEAAYACGGAISVAPLIPGVRAGLRLAKQGQAISVRGRIGNVIARAAGAIVADSDGEPFPEALDTPHRELLIATDERDLSVLREAIALA